MTAKIDVKNIIAIASGKGGVGKSTLAINLAIALSHHARVGLLDADIYGPSQPVMLAAAHEKAQVADHKLQPIMRCGLQTMSIGYLIDGTVPLAWRGPMLGKALQQLTFDTAWQALDYLVIDLPPGTGDVQLTMCQKVPVTAAIMVTTPQDIALVDVRRACEMFKKLNVPMLGIVENMSHFRCSHCGEITKLFSEGAAEKLKQAYGLPLLASIPFDQQLHQLTDTGQAGTLAATNPEIGAIFNALAQKVHDEIIHRPRDHSHHLKNIKIEVNPK